MKTCPICNKEFEELHGKQIYCSAKCRYAGQWQMQLDRAKLERTSPYIRNERRPKPSAPIMTNEEQAAIDKAVFIRTAVRFEPARTYKPGDPEFEAIASTITPIENIPKERFHYHRTIKPF